ncbi:hypothetical protein [Runella sp. SP2]|uniref:hypothetical protein n=1 Tax=Runella sp. SP2 TaxID=2268026 RepID=UPI000F08DD55|nr:hypothetical protein [Runella sp. SP2]AYQ31467.1 hypothetical protein DTQ70_04385 [Runella sp. SP2]
MQAIITTPAYDLSKIFTNAWELVKEQGKKFADALKSAWDDAKAAVKKLSIDLSKLGELTVTELKEIQAAVEATISIKESDNSPEKKYAHKIQTIKTSNSIKTISPYNEEFVKKARGLRGTFINGEWVFDLSVEDHVIKAMIACYSVSGLHPYEVCTLTVKEYNEEVWHSGVELFGRPIAKAWGRDSGAKAQDDIFLLDGRFTSGGSVKNWRTCVKNATFEIHNYPVAGLERADVLEAIQEGWVEVKY